MTSVAGDVIGQKTSAPTDMLRVLVVDDDELDRRAVRRALSRSGLAHADVAEAADAGSAIAMLTSQSEQPFGCVLLDYDLAGDTGVDVLHALADRNRDVPVVMLTGQSDPLTAAASIKAGATDFLTKDLITPERLEQVVRAAIRVGQAHAEAREARTLLAVTLGSIADAVITVDVRGRILYMNPAAEELTGWPPSEAVGQPFEKVAYVIAFDDRADDLRRHVLHERIGRVIRGDQFDERDDMTLVSRDGRQLYVDAIVRQLRDASGHGSGAVIALRDITRRKNAETALADANRQLQQQAEQLEQQVHESLALTEELEHANEQMYAAKENAERARAVAEEANRAKSEFLANMSHELRTPLNAIGGYAELLADGIRGPITSPQRADLDRIKKNQRYLLSLINDILNFAKLEAGRVQFVCKPVSMNDSLGQLEALVQPQLDQKELTYDYQCCDSSFKANVDPERLQQILLNLLSNAIKFTPSGGSVRVLCAATPTHMEVRVADTGVGIPADKLESIFEPFVQLDRGQPAGNVGTGLGLAISRDLARAMGGDLSVTSIVGKGSTFILSLPRASH